MVQEAESNKAQEASDSAAAAVPPAAEGEDANEREGPGGGKSYEMPNRLSY